MCVTSPHCVHCVSASALCALGLCTVCSLSAPCALRLCTVGVTSLHRVFSLCTVGVTSLHCGHYISAPCVISLHRACYVSALCVLSLHHGHYVSALCTLRLCTYTQVSEDTLQAGNRVPGQARVRKWHSVGGGEELLIYTSLHPCMCSDGHL